ncbi:hypothetical protein [Fodinicurvata sp. EGI_FJ10296]|uniref:hypothetical protein n=1 Tax=Fodinicurvata sp. EGI_FJ10296 TaxID=3231908 RepID=UPI0034541A68
MGDSFSIGDSSGMYLPGQTHLRSSANNDPQPTKEQAGPEKIGTTTGSSSKNGPGATGSGGDASGDRAEDAAAFEPATFKNSRYQVKMDGETGQVFTDIVDPATDAVVGRIPSYFKPSDEIRAESSPAEPTGRRTVTI